MSQELALIGADTSNQQAGGNSFFDSATMFTGASVLSGLAGIYNTVVEYGNKAGLETEQIDVSRVLESYDQNWYQYYKENKQLVDVSGFVAGSFIPGGLAVKGLKLLQAGKSAGAIGRAVQGPLNFAASRRDAYLEKGLAQIASEGGSAYSYINSNKLASMAWGVADNVLQAAAFEGAVALTMSKSPVLADASTKDVLSDIAFGAFVGGAFGGAIDAIVTNKLFKDTVKQAGLKQRGYDTFNRYEMGGVGDEAYGLVDSILALPKSIRDDDKLLQMTNPLNKKTMDLNLESNLTRALNKTERQAYAEVKLTLGKLGGEEAPEVGQAMSSMVLDMVRNGLNAGNEPSAIKQRVGDYLLGLKSVKLLKDDVALDIKSGEELFYIRNTVDLEQLAAGGNSIDTFMKLAKSRTPFEKNATAKPYQVVGDVSTARINANAVNFTEAFENGADIAVIGGKMRINPNSSVFKKVTDPTLIPSRYINTRTGGVSDEVVYTWADMIPAGAKTLDSITEDGVLYGKQVLRVADNIFPADAFTATARHAWASQLDDSALLARTVDVQDISLMEKVVARYGENIDEAQKFKLPDGTIVTGNSVGDVRNLLVDTKLSRVQELLDEGVSDFRDIAYRVNVPEDWLERALANGFTRTGDDTLVENSWRNLDEYLKRENFIATWQSPRSLVELDAVQKEVLEATETAAAGKGAKYLDSFVTGDLGFQQRVADSELRRKNAFYSVFGSEDASRFVNVDAAELVRLAEETGVGAGTFSFANASYGEKLKLWSQTTGKLTNQLIQKVANGNLEKLQPFIATFADNARAGAELGVITTMLRRSPDKFVMVLNQEGKQSLAIRELTFVDRASGERLVDNAKLSTWMEANAGKQAVFDIEHKEVGEFLSTWQRVNGDRIAKRSVIMNSRGATLGWDPAVVYAPPINTQKYPYFAFVKIREGHIASTSDVGMITARSAQELQELSNSVPKEMEVFFKKDTEQFYKIKNEYDAALSLNEPRVNSLLRRSGKLGDTFYETRSQNVLEDFISYSQAADTALVRHGVDTRYAQLTTELNALGTQFTEVATSQASGATKFFDRTAVNPFGDYVRTALDLSKRSSFPLISQLNEFVDSAGVTAYRILTSNTEKAQKGLIGWEEAEKIATRYGIGGAYNAENAATAYAIANRPMDRNLIKETVSKANMALATLGLRLDFANSIVNVVSMPIMLGSELQSLRGLAKSDPKLIGALNELTTINPAGGVATPSYTKIIGNAVKNVVGPGGKELIESYRATGDVKNVVLQFHQMMDDLAINPRVVPTEWGKKVDGWIEKGAKWTGNNFSEDFTRAVSANVMDQLTEPLVQAAKLTKAEAEAYRSVFVNRVNGNYIASQRPIVFQGTVGSAVSLFQTYMFNVMQQLTRHIENRDTRAIMTMGGLQGGLYGLNGLPFFDAVNTHLIGNAAINDGHRDIYSTTTQLAGKDMGDWLLYGTASAFPLFGDKAPALYTRGDINPRHVSVLPISPRDIPAVDVSIKVAKNIGDIGAKLMGGADIGSSLLEGLEHNGVSRPLAGFAQIAQGYTTTGKGSLISASNEFDAVVAATRALGAKPMDESVALNSMFRLNAYRAADMERLNGLGAIVKTKLRNGQSPTSDELNDFMKKYASAGGNITNYSAAISRWSRDANSSVVEQMKRHHTSSYAQRMTEIMAGTSLEDFWAAQQQLTEQ